MRIMQVPMRAYVHCSGIPTYVQRRIRQICKIGHMPMGVCMLTERADAEPLNILRLAKKKLKPLAAAGGGGHRGHGPTFGS